MENKSYKKLVIVIAILFTIIIGILVTLIIIGDNKKQNNLNNYDLKKLNNEEIRLVNIPELNKYLFTMENNLYTKENNSSQAYNTLINNYSKEFMFQYIPFLKIDDKKLYWKVNNKWIKDNKITDEITYINYFSSDVTIYKFIVITKTKIYLIEIPNGIETMSEVLENKSLSDFNNKYPKLKYEVINKQVQNILEKYEPNGCHLTSELYLLINDKVYYLNNDNKDVVSVDNKDFTKLTKEYLNTCEYDIATIDVDKNGNILNSNIDKSKISNIKYYLKNNKFEMLIDSNMNYYLKEDNNSCYGKIDKLSFNKDSKLLTLTVNNENIILKEISSYTYD